MRAFALSLALLGGLAGCKSTTSASSGLIKDADGLTTTPPSAESQRLYDAVRDALAAKHGGERDRTWQETTGDLSDDWLVQTPDRSAWDSPVAALPYGTPCTGGADCDPDFKIKRCADDAACGSTGFCRPVLASVKKPGDEPVRMCVGGGDFVYDRIYSQLIKAQKTIDIISLSPPDGRYRVAMENAFLYLDSAGMTPSIRLLFGGEDSTNPTLTKPTTFLKEAMASLLARKPDYKLPIALAWLSHFGSWNHAKIVAVDGASALVGGQNFWERVYLQADPVFDASAFVTGPAAAAATRFADVLWNLKPISVGVLPVGTPINYKHAPEGAQPAGATKMIGVGRLGGFGDNAADTAFGALFAAAKTSIKISQQDIYRRLSLAGPFGSDELVDAIIRGVDVYLLKSSVVSVLGYGLFSAQDSLDFLGRAVEKKAGKGKFLRKKGTYWRQVCDKVHFVGLRYSPENPADGQVKSHTKIVMVDDAAMYVGSHNLYPANLQEYGYVLFGETMGAQFNAEYWTPAWKNSASNQVPCNPVD